MRRLVASTDTEKLKTATPPALRFSGRYGIREPPRASHRPERKSERPRHQEPEGTLRFRESDILYNLYKLYYTEQSDKLYWDDLFF